MGLNDCDRDRFPASVDCDDSAVSTHPGARDAPGNKVDEDCDGSDAAYPLLGSHIHYRYRFAGGRVVLTSLTIQPARKGSTIRVRCSGGGCRFQTKRREITSNARSLDLTSLVRTARLRKGAILEIRASRPDAIGAVLRLTVRSRRRIAQRDLCLAPGATKTAPCPL